MAQDLPAALGALAATRGPQGGFGWRAGAPANTECTALAVLTLGAWQGVSAGPPGALQQGIAWLESRQLEDGSWPLGDEVPGSSWSTSLACCALSAGQPGGAERAVRGGRWLLRSRSRGYSMIQRFRMSILREPPLVDQDQQIPGWGWTAETSAWVEPTAWALLALKQLRSALPRHDVAERIDRGHALLADRMCRGGGWNYGNKAVLGSDLPPYPDTTALALLALQDHRSAAVTDPSLARLERMLGENRSSLALALAVLAMQLHGRDVTTEREELRQRLNSLASDVDVRTLALVLLALDEQQVPFRVPPDA